MGTHLNGNHTREFQIVEFLLETVAKLDHIVKALRVLLRPGLLGLALQLRKLMGADVREALLARQNIHRQLFIILQVLFIELVQHGGILQQRDLMLLEFLADFVNIGLRLGILRFERLNLVFGLLKESEQAAFFVSGLLDVVQRRHQRAEGVSDFA